MSQTDVENLLARINELPMMPKTILALMDEFNQEEADIDRIAALIGADPVLAAKLLRLANSAFYHRSRNVSRIDDAVVFIGTHATRNLVLATGLAASIRFPAWFPKKDFWRYSLHTGVAARYFARCGRKDPETAFATGLIRAIGEPLTAAAMQDKIMEINTQTPFFEAQRLQQETQSLGFNYVDVTCALARQWNFPEELVDILAQSDTSNYASASPLGTAVAVGAWVVGQLEAGRELEREEHAGLLERLRKAGMPIESLDEMPPLAELSEGLEQMF